MTSNSFLRLSIIICFLAAAKLPLLILYLVGYIVLDIETSSISLSNSKPYDSFI